MNVVTVERKRIVIEPGTQTDRWLVSAPGLGCVSSSEDKPSTRRIEQLITTAVSGRRAIRE